MWYDGISADTTWVNGDNAYFTNTAGTVTLTTSVTAGNVIFTNVTGSYYITNATGAEQLTVNNSIDTGGSEDTIAAIVNNSGTLNKNGAGRLHLPMANNINAVNINQGALSFENNSSVSGNITVADGASLEINNTNSLSNIGNTVTINGSGINGSGALNNVAGLNTFYGQVILGENNSVINVGTNAAFIYWGSDGSPGTPITDNGTNFNLIISGPFGNVQFADFGLTIGGSLYIEPSAACYMYLSGTTTNFYTSSIISTNATLFAQGDNGLGAPPVTAMRTNVVIDGGTLIGFGTWTMNANRGITVTTNGGTISDSNTGGTWTMSSLYSSNTPVTFKSSGGTIHIGAANSSAVLNLGTGSLIANGGNIGLGSETAQPTYSNLVVNGCTFTFNYDSTSGQLSQLGSLPSSFSQSNIWLNGGQFHMGHSSTIQANRGIYVGPSGTTLNEVTSSGTATWGSIISGPGNITFATATHVLTANNTYTGNTTINSSTSLTVGSGANGSLGTGNTANSGTLTFNRSSTTYTYGGVISGTGTVVKNSGGTVALTGINTYTGATTIGGGALLINGTNGTSAITANASGTLGGTGLIKGTVAVAGTLALGAGTLSVSNNVSITGSITVSVNKSLSQPNGMANVSGTLANTGTGKVIVNSSGPALAVGDTFHIFNQPLTGGNTMTITNTGTSITWNNNLAVDGTISVATLPAPGKPVITSAQVINGAFVFSGTNGTPGQTNFVLTTTNLTLPLNQWTLASTNVFPASGPFFITNPIDPNSPQMFYLLQVQ